MTLNSFLQLSGAPGLRLMVGLAIVLTLTLPAVPGKLLAQASRLSTPVGDGLVGKAFVVNLEDEVGAEQVLRVAAVTPVSLLPFPVEALSALPADLGKQVLYGSMRLGKTDANISLLVDIREDGSERLFVDQNDDEDLSNDPPLSWQGEYAVGGLGQAILPAMVVDCHISCDGEQSVPIHLKLRRFDRKQVKGRSTITFSNGILVAVDTYRRGVLKIGEEQLQVALLPTAMGGRHALFSHPANALVVDLNQDGTLDGRPMRSAERFRLDSPFIFKGRGFKVTETSCDGHRLQIAEVDPRQVRSQQRQQRGLALGEPAPDFNLESINGDMVRLDSYRGKVVLLDFWATWCGPCRVEMPHVKAAYERYHAQGFEIIGISLDTNTAVVERYAKANGLQWPQILQARGVMTPLKQNYGVRSIPAAFLIGRDGELLSTRLRGERLLDEVRAAIAAKPGGSD